MNDDVYVWNSRAQTN